MSIITLADAKSHLGISSTDYDLVLARVVSGVEQGIRRWTKRRLDRYEAEVEYHSGHGRQRLYLKNRPVVDITSVRLDASGYFGQGSGAFASGTEITQGVDWVLESSGETEHNMGCLLFLRGGWPQGTGNIKVVYDHGYQYIPADLRLGCLMLVAGIYADIANGGPLQSENLGDYSYVLANTAASSGNSSLREAMNLIRPFREVSL